MNAWYSLGFRTSDQTVQDVLFDSPAFRAGLGPGMKLVAINGRQANDELLRSAIRDAKDEQRAYRIDHRKRGVFPRNEDRLSRRREVSAPGAR